MMLFLYALSVYFLSDFFSLFLHTSSPLLSREHDDNNIHPITIQRPLVFICIITLIWYYRRIPKKRITVDGNQNQIIRRVDNVGILKETDHFYLSHLTL